MRSLSALCILLAVTLPLAAHAEAPDDPPPGVGIEEKLGQSIPLDLKLIDEQGERVAVRDIIDKPTILTLNYFRCTGLCSPLLNGVADLLKQIDEAPGKDFQVVTVSFDPRDNAELAGQKKANYIKQLGPGFPAQAWRFLTGDPVSTKQLADSVGFGFVKHGEDYIHPGAIMVLSPAGRVARYLYGVTFLPFDVKMALAEAAQGRSGPTIARFLRFCYSYDPSGRGYFFDITRVAGALILLLAVGFGITSLLKRRRHPPVDLKESR